MNRIEIGSWVPGSVLRVYSPSYLVNHFGIAGSLDQSGRPTVYHASKDRCSLVLTFYEEFAGGQQPVYVWQPQNLEAQQAVLTRAQSLVGRPYDLMRANCEDYVNWIVMGIASSPQRTIIGVAALGIVVLGLWKQATSR